MNSNPIPIGKSPAPSGRFDVREIGRAALLAILITTVITGLSIETDRLDHLSASAAQAARTPPGPEPAPAVHREPAWTDAPLRGMSPSEIWAADESAHGLRPEAAH